jgi:DNA-binding ferritin-like protein
MFWPEGPDMEGLIREFHENMDEVAERWEEVAGPVIDDSKERVAPKSLEEFRVGESGFMEMLNGKRGASHVLVSPSLHGYLSELVGEEE